MGIMKRVKDIPKDDRPREELLKKGPEALADLELMAILIGRGIVGHDVMTLAGRVLKLIEEDHGKINIDALQKIEGVGPAKASVIA